MCELYLQAKHEAKFFPIYGMRLLPVRYMIVKCERCGTIFGEQSGTEPVQDSCPGCGNTIRCVDVALTTPTLAFARRLESPQWRSRPTDAGDPHHLLQGPELLKGPSDPQRHGAQRIIGERHRHPGLLGEQSVEAAEQRPAAGHDDPAVDDIGRELRRRPLQGHLHGLHDPGDWLCYRFTDFRAGHPHGPG